MSEHLTLMSKPRLVDIIGRSQQETRQAKAAAAYWQRRYADAIAGRYRHELTPAEALAVAAEILDTIGPDPKAAQHRLDLERAIYPRCEKRVRPGPRQGPMHEAPVEADPSRKGSVMTRAEHLQWSKDRALQYVNAGDLHNAFASMCSDLRKHPELENHAGAQLGMMLMLSDLLGTEQKMREWIVGFN